MTYRVLVVVTTIKVSHLNLLSCLLRRDCGSSAKSDVVMRSLWLAQCSKDRRVKSLIASWSNSLLFTALGLACSSRLIFVYQLDVETVVVVFHGCSVTTTNTASGDAVYIRVVTIVYRLRVSATTDASSQDAVYIRIVPVVINDRLRVLAATNASSEDAVYVRIVS